VTTWRDLIDPILDGVEAYVASHDVDALLRPELQRAANKLAATLDEATDGVPDGVRPAGLVALAGFRWTRYLAQRGRVSGLRDRREATRFYELLAAADPETARQVTPERVRLLLAEPKPAERVLRASHDEARDLLGAAQETRDLVVMREGIELLRYAIPAAPPESEALPEVWHTLGLAWRLWFATTREEPALNHAIAAHRESAAALRTDDPERADRHQELYALLHQRLELGGAPRCLDEAIEVLRIAVAALPDGDERKPGWLIGLARDLLEQSGRDGTLEPVEEAHRVLVGDVGAASHATPVDAERFLSLLADIYERLAELTGDPAASEAAHAARAAAAAL
jgi:hypothetical protein